MSDDDRASASFMSAATEGINMPDDLVFQFDTNELAAFVNHFEGIAEAPNAEFQVGGANLKTLGISLCAVEKSDFPFGQVLVSYGNKYTKNWTTTYDAEKPFALLKSRDGIHRDQRTVTYIELLDQLEPKDDIVTVLDESEEEESGTEANDGETGQLPSGDEAGSDDDDDAPLVATKGSTQVRQPKPVKRKAANPVSTTPSRQKPAETKANSSKKGSGRSRKSARQAKQQVAPNYTPGGDDAGDSEDEADGSEYEN